MFTKEEYEKYKEMVNANGATSVDISKRKYMILGTYGCTIYCRIGSTWKSKHISDWRNKSYTQANVELRNQHWRDEG